jgi:tetratricopeptide (TPR) repeat protein
MLVDAWRPRAIIGRVGVTSVAGLAAGLAVIAGLVALIRRRARLSANTALGLALFFGALLPVLHVVPIPLLTLTADRFLYLPTAGLVLAYAPALDGWLGTRRPRWAAAVALSGSLALVTFRRVGVWSDEIDFWIETYRETPKTNNAAANELANVYYRAGFLEDALALTERALRYDDPHRTTPYYNAGLCLARLGRYDDARAAFGRLRGKGKGAADVELELAILEVRARNFDAARKLLGPVVRKSTAARDFLEKLPELERAAAELATLDEKSPPARRAQLATLVDEEAIAKRAWLELLRSPSIPKPAARSALEFLLERADRGALIEAASAYRARFGDIEPELLSMIEVHLTELERLISARPRAGLFTREKVGEMPGAPLP